jgi:hypothetical protein
LARKQTEKLATKMHRGQEENLATKMHKMHKKEE